ncbi:PA0069 family radical SAM protein [Polymorphobacter megasporae]|uniref:PA0069 family radical SAM protein n=1 Tax=Glacieibacterium megasporae TaxID=2835787 RepID=UPI001C1DEC6A|nr:PA0069 family radical SAM protein [Polymorphobacter megasporae]UAJ09458.1 PA0069 family radical SAM protein [Polymorphobacter megasporae]
MQIPLPVRGRGAPTNAPSARFDEPGREADLDWLDDQMTVDDGAPPLRTTVTIETPRTIITRNTSPDIPFDRSVNAYRGCEHGCIYCFARPTHAYLGLSPGLDFESRLFAKPTAPALLRKELSRKGYMPAVLAMGTNTDPYQPIEATHHITREMLEVLRAFNHPVSITTKSDRVVADLDILTSLAVDGLVAVVISVTSLDRTIARTLEPRAATPTRRLAAIAALSAAGVPAYVSVSPIVPAITDHEIEAIIEAAAAAGAVGAFARPVRLPNEVAPLFRQWLDTHHPGRAGHTMSLIQSMREGRDNNAEFGTRMKGTGPYAALLHRRVALAKARLGLDAPRPALRTDLFDAPGPKQLGLF